jgi:hypothetical protein
MEKVLEGANTLMECVLHNTRASYPRWWRVKCRWSRVTLLHPRANVFDGLAFGISLGVFFCIGVVGRLLNQEISSFRLCSLI